MAEGESVLNGEPEGEGRAVERRGAAGPVRFHLGDRTEVEARLLEELPGRRGLAVVESEPGLLETALPGSPPIREAGVEPGGTGEKGQGFVVQPLLAPQAAQE